MNSARPGGSDHQKGENDMGMYGLSSAGHVAVEAFVRQLKAQAELDEARMELSASLLNMPNSDADLYKVVTKLIHDKFVDKGEVEYPAASTVAAFPR